MGIEDIVINNLGTGISLQKGKSASNTESKVKKGIGNILDPNCLDSINFVVGKKLLSKKLNSGNTSGITSLLMEVLTSRQQFLEEKYRVDNPNFLSDLKEKINAQSDYYKKCIAEVEKRCQKDGTLEIADNPAWFSLKTKTDSNNANGLNYKMYLTIPINGYDFISKIYQLGLMLNKLATSTGDKMSLKVPCSMLGFLSHSDSIVVHFKNLSNKDEIEKILEEWKNNNGIIEENRNLGRTKFAGDSSTNSFSGLVADNIEKWILEHYGRYDNELIASLAIEYAIKQSQTPPKFN